MSRRPAASQCNQCSPASKKAKLEKEEGEDPAEQRLKEEEEAEYPPEQRLKEEEEGDYPPEQRLKEEEEGEDREEDFENVPSHWKSCLTEWQVAALQKVPGSLRRLIGIKHNDEDTGRQRVVKFFERYLQRDRQSHLASDYFFETKPAQMTGPFARYGVGGFQTTVFTPALYDRSFVGQVVNTPEAAENSACFIFFLDGEVKAIKQKLAPPSKKVHNYIANEIFGSETKKVIRARGFNLTAVLEEAKQEVLSLCRDMEGCRSALWDGNA